MRVIGTGFCVMVLCAQISGSAVSDTYRYQDLSDRGVVKATLYEQCIQDPMKVDGDPTYLQQDQFCRCLGDYLGDLLTDYEIEYVIQELEASESILEKEERANAICNTAMHLQ
jgi:hypothetical protein